MIKVLNWFKFTWIIKVNLEKFNSNRVFSELMRNFNVLTARNRLLISTFSSRTCTSIVYVVHA